LNLEGLWVEREDKKAWDRKRKFGFGEKKRRREKGFVP
jgi:hypothetical protein